MRLSMGMACKTIEVQLAPENVACIARTLSGLGAENRLTRNSRRLPVYVTSCLARVKVAYQMPEIDSRPNCVINAHCSCDCTLFVHFRLFDICSSTPKICVVFLKVYARQLGLTKYLSGLSSLLVLLLGGGCPGSVRWP